MMKRVELLSRLMVRFGARCRGAARARRGVVTPGLICLTLLVAVGGGAAMAAPDPFGTRAAVEEVRRASLGLSSRLDEMPRQIQLEFGTEAHLLVESAYAALAAVERQPAAVISHELLHGLAMLADIENSVTAELGRFAGRGSAERQEAQLARLFGAADEQLSRIGRELDAWSERARQAVLELDDASGSIVIRSIDRTVHDGIRFIAVGLLLVGLLVFGLRLLALSETEAPALDLVRQAPVLAVGGLLTLGAFLVASATLAISPTVLAGLSGQVEVLPAEHACERLAAQRDQLVEARALGHDGLSDAVKKRMRPAAQACLGLDSQVAAVEAVEQLARRLDPLEGGFRRLAASHPQPAPLAPSIDVERARAASTVRPPDAVPPSSPVAVDAAAMAGEPLAAGGPEEAVPDEPDGAAPGSAEPARSVVTTTRVNYRAGPSTDARRLGTLAQGTGAVLLGEDVGWSNIQLADGRSVYVASAFLRPDR